MKKVDRRQFLSMLISGAATPFVVSIPGCGGGAAEDRRNANNGGGESGIDDTPHTVFPSNFPNVDASQAALAFPHSVSSGDPAPTGVVLWTRVNPNVIMSGEPLYLEVAQVDDFSEIVYQLTIAAADFGASRDYTVSIDTETLLFAGRTYYYRFIYAGFGSRTGRCKTAPIAGAQIDHLKIAMVSCQDYTNGYYGALNAIAEDDTLDFVIHLGDFIYETAGDARFQSLPFADRRIILPSDLNFNFGFPVALDLEDYRHIYRTYRSDPFLQRAMERHTWIITRDDHETGDDAYWDYANDTLGLPEHPYTLEAQFAGDRSRLLNQLMLDSQQAWLEYVPARVIESPSSTDPFERLKYFRRLQFGDLIDLFMLDGRTYRSIHPCATLQGSERFFPDPSCNDWFENQQQTLLGQEQREWLINGLGDSSSVWQVLGNQTPLMPIWQGSGGSKANQTPITLDTWNGYDFERDLILREAQATGSELVVLTGDLHSYIVSDLKLDFLDTNENNVLNYVGVEFTAPSLTSAGLIESSTSALADIQNPIEQAILTSLLPLIASGSAVSSTNPHIKFFNSSHHGYAVVEFTRSECEWTAYIVDKNVNNGSQAPVVLSKYVKTKGNHLVNVRTV